MNYFGGGDAAPPVGVKGSSGGGRGRVKPNAPEPIAGSLLTAPQQQQRPAVMEPVPRDCGRHSNGLPQLDAGETLFRNLTHSETPRDSQVQKRKEEACESVNTLRSSHRVAISLLSSKPDLQIYRPPATPVCVKGRSGHGRGGVKPNAPAPIAASSLTAPLQQQRPVAMELAPRDCGPHCNALPQLDAGDEWRQRSETPRDSQLQKVKEEGCESVNTPKSSRRVATSPLSSKPGRQIYRPPAPPVGVKGSSGHGRGGVKPNAPAPIAASSLTAPLQQQRPVAMELAPRDCGPHCNALPQLDAGDEWRQRSETPRDSQLQKVKEEGCESVNTPRSSRRVATSPHSSKPGRQIYRPPAMNYFGGGDAAPPVGVKGSSGHGRGGVKLNAPAPIAASSLTAPLQQQRPVAMELAPRDCGPHCNALPQLDAGDEWRQRSDTPRDSQLQKVKEEDCESVNTPRSSRRVATSPLSSKPDRQMYRPPGYTGVHVHGWVEHICKAGPWSPPVAGDPGTGRAPKALCEAANLVTCTH
ncbi:uncharacterized protein LOC119433349 [Dermacentor silvarum]|uniref:uncharacterized protein LOC119433349 n=1 Tax=Dermacentor silvarum TaxID=543639 RepID=UPI002101435D|nr:uncharacterized protein LOC119433349 [Dermacentor silvarum]